MIMLKAVGLRVRVAIAIASRSAHGDMLMLNNNHGSPTQHRIRYLDLLHQRQSMNQITEQFKVSFARQHKPGAPNDGLGYDCIGSMWVETECERRKSNGCLV